MTEVSRRQLLAWGGGAGTSGLIAGVAAGVAAGRGDPTGAPALADQKRLSPYQEVVPHGEVPHGLDRPVPAFGHVLAFNLSGRPGPSQARTAAIRALRWLTTALEADVSTQESAAAAAALGSRPSSLQITPGIGASLLGACGLQEQRPSRLIDLPAFATDRLDPTLCGGDLMVQLGAEDPMRLAGAVQAVRTALLRDWDVAWSRSGFRITPAGAEDPHATVRNLMGHRDGTANRPIGSPLWKASVLSSEDGWMNGGSYVVARQIRIDLDRWFAQPQALRDQVIGRDTLSGAPLGRHREHEQVDLAARDAHGAPAVPLRAHIRLAGTRSTLGALIYRRGWNFDDGDQGGRNAGLIFMAWQADIAQGFLPIQRSLVHGRDRLSDFTTHVGSAVFAVPALGSDDYVGQRLLEAS